jgi:hypothetical protein
VVETLIDTEEAEKILSYLQYRIAQKFSAGEDVLSLLPSADIATCLHILEQLDATASTQHLNH